MKSTWTRSARHARALAAVFLLALLPVGCAEPEPIPDLEVTGPPDGFEMGSRLMTSPSKMEVRLTVPGQGTVKVPRFNGTFFYRQEAPESTSATLLFRPDQFEDVDGTLSQTLIDALDFDHHPFFAFQSHTAEVSGDGVELKGKLIVKERETDATLRLQSPGEVAVNEEGGRWIRIKADMDVSTVALDLESLGDRLRFDIDLFLKGYTARSAEKTGIDPAALDKSPPSLPGKAEELSDAGWYLILTGRYPEAIAAFDRSLEKDPSIVNTYLRRGDAYLFDGQYGKALGTYRAMSEYMPVHPHMMELSKILDREYLTPESLQAANREWLARQ